MEKFKSFISSATYCLSRTWLLGSLFRAGRKAYAAALYEFTYALAWSILPFILGALTLYVTSDAEHKEFIPMMVETFRNGELLIYTISMLAPILYVVLYDPEEAQPFPHKLPISTLVAVTAVTCSALFALMKAHAVKDSQFVLQLSMILTVFALIVRFLSLVYHRARLPMMSERDLRAGQDRFTEQYGKHLGEPIVAAQSAADLSAAFGSHVGDKE